MILTIIPILPLQIINQLHILLLRILRRDLLVDEFLPRATFGFLLQGRRQGSLALALLSLCFLVCLLISRPRHGKGPRGRGEGERRLGHAEGGKKEGRRWRRRRKTDLELKHARSFRLLKRRVLATLLEEAVQLRQRRESCQPYDLCANRDASGFIPREARCRWAWPLACDCPRRLS